MRKHNYLVGYKGEGQCVYGNQIMGSRFTDPITLFQAKKLRNQICFNNGYKKIKSVIYKLVEIK